MKNEYRADRIIATSFVLATAAFMATYACSMYTQACAYREACEIAMQQVKQVWQRERTELIRLYS